MSEIIDERYQLKNGMYLEDEQHSRMMYALRELHPEYSSDYTWDEMGIAALMCRVYADEIRYCPQNRSWYIWDKRWEKQIDAGIVSDMLQTLLNLLRLYADEIDNEDYKKFISTVRKYNAIKNIIELLKTMCRLYSSEMDTNPYILNTQTGAYDLRTGDRVEDITEYNVTKITNTYPENALSVRCDRWYKFIDEIMSGDKDKAKFLQRALGYSILGVNKSECMFIAYGSTTRNGKGTLIESIKRALSEDYVKSAATELICVTKGGKTPDYNAPQPGLAQLVGSRIAIMSESEQSVSLAAAAIKALTGRDTRPTRDLYESSFNFTPQFTMWLMTNYLPAVNDDTIFRSNRIWVITFNESFADDSKRNEDLKDYFALPENQPTILSWLMEGCRDYLQNGLCPPDVVRADTMAYKERFDKIGAFIKDCCEEGSDKKVVRGKLYSAYINWCSRSDNKCSAYGTTRFYSEMELRGYPVVKNSDFFIKGLDLLPQAATIKVT